MHLDYIIKNFCFTDYVVNITQIQHHYMENGVEVILFLEENQIQDAAVTYSISIIPPTPLINLNSENGTVQITNLTYNTQYNVSINTSICRSTTYVILLYSK